MQRRRIVSITMAGWMACFLLTACGPSSEAAAKPKSKDRRNPVVGNGQIEATGEWVAEFSTMGGGSRAAVFHNLETWGIRLQFKGGPDEYRGAVLQLSRLPAPLTDGTYSFGSGGVRGEFVVLMPNPADSGLRFHLESGQLILRVSGDRVSGSVHGEAEEHKFERKERRTISLRGEFEGVEVRR